MVWCFLSCLSVQWYKKPLNTAILFTLIPYSWPACFAHWYYKCPIIPLPTFLSQAPNQCPWTKWAIGMEEKKASSADPFCSVSSALCSTTSLSLASWLCSWSFCLLPLQPQTEALRRKSVKASFAFFFPDFMRDQWVLSESFLSHFKMNNSATPSEILKAHCENINSAAFALGIMHLWEM